ncbi:hypothetical protein [Chamaesiphon sp.]|uniref:hypothetical protein n=1 Tax=Chamaesiphon sp. TaxID=2814140 RepID=UPI00359391AE
MKIIIALLVLILLGIVVGSNLFPTMTVVILNQPTVALPIGVWLMLAIGAGVLSSITIQLLISIDRRLLKRQINRSQSRAEQQDEDNFTYTPPVVGVASPAENRDSSSRDTDAIPTKTSRFKSYRTNLTDRFTNRSSAQPMMVDDSDDWEVEPVANRQLDWEDSTPQRQQNLQSPTNSPNQTERIYAERRTEKIDSASQSTSREVYDADFRLIQPPYKQPLQTEFDLEDAEIDLDEDDDKSTPSVKPTSPNRSTPSSNLDDEDWGFDFESRDTPVRTK